MNDNDRIKVIVNSTGSIRTIPYRIYRRSPRMYTLASDIKTNLPDEGDGTAEEKVERLKEQLKAQYSQKSEPTKTDDPEGDYIPTSDTKEELPDFETMELPELKELADKEGVEYAKNAGKKKMIELLTK